MHDNTNSAHDSTYRMLTVLANNILFPLASINQKKEPRETKKKTNQKQQQINDIREEKQHQNNHHHR